MDGTGRLVFPAVDVLDQMYARYTVQPETRGGTMAMFCAMINIATVNSLVIYANNIHKVQPEKKIKRNTFCSELHMIW
jgi:hypothetical protein